MGLFGCSHDWEVRVKTFAPPKPVDAAVVESCAFEDTTVSYVERCHAGVTTVLLVCQECGDTNVVEMLGKDGSP